MATYGDGLANIDLSKLVTFHDKQGKLATVTAVRPPARFGVLKSENGLVVSFGEKRQSDTGWINGGFFVFEPEVKFQIKNIFEPLETGVLPKLVEKVQLSAYEHEGFWQPMDTLREKQILAELSQSVAPPWLDF